jgi:hypothetical protein
MIALTSLHGYEGHGTPTNRRRVDPRYGQFDGWALFLTGSAYVLAASVFLAAVYARDALTIGQEALAWITPWVIAVVLWASVGHRIGPENAESGLLQILFFGLVIGTPSYLAWQTVALVLRRLKAWRSRGGPIHR